jgi:peptidoglycan/xylan/chitin deacetylase (PgdA/CDA1 family)
MRRGSRSFAARSRRRAVAGALAACIAAAPVGAADCKGTLYLTIDTGSMSQAELIARTLAKHDVKATFFLANEKTVNGDHSLDSAWGPYWKARVAEGHAFGSHTWHHGYFRGDLPGGKVKYVVAGKPQELDAAGVCAELKRSEQRFRELTGRGYDPIWRAPGGYTTPNALAAARTCGFTHVHWAPAGFLGDELPSDKYPNDALLKRALANLRDGDVMVMHTGIWSRKEPFAPMLDPLLAGLKAKGFCFAAVTPDVAAAKAGRN